MINFFNTKSPINKETLNRILSNTISARLEKKNFKWNNQLLWFTNSNNSIRYVFKYYRLKGEQGTFAWGVCLDFVPTIYGNNLKFHRTEKSVTLQLFEWTDEYANSFNGGKLDNGVTTHWGEKDAKKSIVKLFDRYENKIFNWFKKANSIGNLIQIATDQIKEGKSYSIHSPNPRLVLSFLLAKSGQLDNALSTLELLDDYENNNDVREKIKLKLISLADNTH